MGISTPHPPEILRGRSMNRCTSNALLNTWCEVGSVNQWWSKQSKTWWIWVHQAQTDKEMLCDTVYHSVYNVSHHFSLSVCINTLIQESGSIRLSLTVHFMQIRKACAFRTEISILKQRCSFSSTLCVPWQWYCDICWVLVYSFSDWKMG